jgi:hypothetical protein
MGGIGRHTDGSRDHAVHDVCFRVGQIEGGKSKIMDGLALGGFGVALAADADRHDEDSDAEDDSEEAHESEERIFSNSGVRVAAVGGFCGGK